MSQFKTLAVSLGAAFLVAACGGSDKVTFSSMVSFGDSLSDVGTYKVGTVAALGGGLYTVNGISGAMWSNPTPSKNWTELVSASIGQTAPCPAQTGLDGDATQGFFVPVVNHSACRNYAQGGSRVTHPVGPGNKLLGAGNATLGQLTVPVMTQISNHLGTVGGSFSGQELVTVAAGANDIFINLATIAPTVAFLVTPGGGGLDLQTATSTASNAAVTAMATAGAELAGYIKTQILGKGARYVIVVNVPDVSKTPFAYGQDAATQDLINRMSATFNTQLQTGLNGANVRIADAYSDIRNQAANPALYGLTNVTTPACNLTAPVPNALGSSLVCTVATTSATGNVIPGDTSHYLFSDTVHPSPYGYKLFADLVSAELSKAGWL